MPRNARLADIEFARDSRKVRTLRNADKGADAVERDV
jgi:hypothetical protein